MEINQVIRCIESTIPSNCELTNEELVALIQKDVDVMKNMGILYAKNIKYILSIASKMSQSGVDVQELMQEGYFGLCKAVNHFSFEYETKFLTFATWEIKSAMQKYILRMQSAVKFPARWQELLYKYRNFINKYVQDTGEEPSDEVVMSALNFKSQDLEHVKELQNASNSVSLDMPLQVDESLTIQDSLASEMDVENDIISEMTYDDMKIKLWKEIDELPSDDAYLVKQVFLKNKTLSELAPSLGISQQTTSQRMKRILSDLKENETIRIIKINCFGENMKPSDKKQKKQEQPLMKNKTKEMIDFEKEFATLNDNIFKDILAL